LEVITGFAKEDIEQLTQNDIVIMCGGTNNISKNELNKGLRHVTQFVQNKGNTNVIVMNAPHRFDLEERSCVSKEVEVFNRKLNKIMKRYNHIKIITMSEERGHYTKHGLHMNKSGKKWITKKTADFINKLFANPKPPHITMKWEGIEQKDPVRYNTETMEKTTTPERTQQSTGTKKNVGSEERKRKWMIATTTRSKMRYQVKITMSRKAKMMFHCRPHTQHP